jgi:hypothetical protein
MTMEKLKGSQEVMIMNGSIMDIPHIDIDKESFVPKNGERNLTEFIERVALYGKLSQVGKLQDLFHIIIGRHCQSLVTNSRELLFSKLNFFPMS